MNLIKSPKNILILLLTYMLFYFTSYLIAQTQGKQPIQDKSSKHLQYPVLQFTPKSLNGFAKAISGETIYYHSPIPEANLALLVHDH